MIQRIQRVGRAIVLGLACVMVTGCGPGIADYEQSLGNGYLYVSTGPLQNFILQGRDYAIPSLVVDFDYDTHFIVALRLVVLRHRCDPGSTLVDLVTTDAEYWVVDKENRLLHGPLNRDGFIKLRNELEISDEIRLDESTTDKALKKSREYRMEERIRSLGCQPIDSSDRE